MYPVDIVFVRHGESEGDVAQFHSKLGDDALWTEEFSHRHTSKYRLTDKGREQARLAGEWIKTHIGPQFDRYYASEFARAKETAALLDIPNAEWFLEFFIREQDMGVFAGKSHLQRKEQFKDELRFAKSDSLYWAPPGGESLARACLRVDRVLSQLKSQCSGCRVLLVCHGNIMTCFRVRLERMSQEAFYEWTEEQKTNPKAKINHAQIYWYSRRDPVTGRVHGNLRWMRSICPWDESLSNDWVEIKRPSFTNQQLFDQVESIPQLVNTTQSEALLLAASETDSPSIKRPKTADKMVGCVPERLVSSDERDGEHVESSEASR